MAQPSKKSRTIFFKAHGKKGPWTCIFCDKKIRILGQGPRSLNVHHLDTNNTNNNIDNLGASHHACHISYHKLGKPGRRFTAKQKIRQSKAQLVRRAREKPSDRDGLREAARATVSDPIKDAKRRKASSESMKKRMQDPEYQAKVLAARWPQS